MRSIIVLRRRARIVWIIAALAVAGWLLADYFWQPQRSFAIEATTHGATITFSGSTSRPWLLPELVVCKRNTARVSPQAGGDDGGADAFCDPRLYTVTTLQDAIVSWPDGARIAMRHDFSRPGLTVSVLEGDGDARDAVLEIEDVEITPGSLLIVPETAFLKTGSLLLSGMLTLGGEPNPGLVDHLVAGSFEVRERLLFRQRPVTVLSGAFFRGDQVSLVKSGAHDRALVTGFFGPAAEATDAAGGRGGLDMAVYSPPEDAALEVVRPGSVSSLIAPNWTDRAVNDPVIIGLTALLALMLAIVEIIIGGYAILSGQAFRDR